MARPLALALVAAWGIFLAMPVLAASTAARVEGHSELLLSLPAAGSILPVGPTEISLVFSEPIEARYSSLDLSDGSGAVILSAAGTPDPTDPDVLTVSLAAPLPAGSYTVSWRASSAADGHDTTGFLVFGVGSVSLSATTQSADASGSLHPGHDSAHAAAEIQGKAAAYGGVMVAFGLAVLALLVLIPGLERVPRGSAYGAAVGLIAAAAGCLVLIVVGATGATTTAPDYLTYATGSRAGVLLTSRLLLGLLAGVAAIVLARRNQPARALLVGGLAASAEIGLIAAGGHAAAFSSPLPVVIDIVHVGAASIWLAGLVALGALTDFGGRKRFAPEVLRDIVRRFSALALVSIALITATGVYAAWIEIGDFTAIRSAYDANLAIKVVFFVLAVAVGALNYLDGGRDRAWLGGLSKRLLLEMCLGIVVVVVAANLTSGSPTGTDRPVAISPSDAAQSATSEIGLAIQPGRPGPNRFLVALPAKVGSGTAYNLDVVQLNQPAGAPASLPLVVDPTDPTGRTLAADVDELPAGSRWTATIVVVGLGGSPTAVAAFSFALDDEGISAGRATPPIDPLVVIAILLLLGSLVGAGLSLAGRSLPRTLPATSRVAVLGGSLVGGVLGIAMLVTGAPR
ncbi:MAG TPA: copper resistance protein CopC [Candidatus Limnocylindrales bacterium]